jgi:ABC-type amino acid transport substrate-binding protein
MRIRVWLAAGLVAAMPLAAAEPKASDAKGPAPLGFGDGGVLRVLRMDARDGDPFFNLSDDRPGFDRELLEGFARLHKLRLEVVTVPSWEDLVPALLQKKGDVAAGRFTITPARSKVVDFTVETFPTRHVVLTRKPKPTILTRDELRGAKVAAVKGSAVEEAVLAAGVPRANIVSVGPQVTSEALKDARVTAIVTNVETAVVEARGDPDLQLGLYLGPPRSLAYAVRKDDTSLRKALDEYLEHTRRSPQWNRLVVKYFGQSGLEILKTAREQK